MKGFYHVFIELDKFDNNNNGKFDLSNIADDLKDWISLFKDSDLIKQYHNQEVWNAVTYVQDILYNNYLIYLRLEMAESARIKKIDEEIEKGIEC